METYRILYEDSYIIVCEKAAGLPVQSARLGVQSLESLLLTHLKEKQKKEGIPYLGVVHRLDQPVRGLVVFARSPRASAALQEQMRGGRMEKIYTAVVRVTENADEQLLSGEEARLENWLSRDARTNMSRVVAGKEAAKGAKKAVLYLRCVNKDEQKKRALLRIRLITGRHHQIRVQLSHAGLPIVGDHKYDTCGDDAGGDAGKTRERFPMLCAASLSFAHPGSGELMHFEAEEVPGRETRR